MATKLKHGNALWSSVTASNLELVDTVWDSWTGRWAIVPALGEAAVLSGTLDKNTDLGKFILRINSTQMRTLTVRKYILVCEAVNSALDYEFEFAQEPITIEAQGIDL